MVVIQIVSHVAVTLLAVVALALRIEHRLTKIETDVTWLKKNLNSLCQGGSKNGSDSQVDQT